MIKKFPILLLSLAFTPLAIATSIDDYKCANYSGQRGPFVPEMVGMGVVNGASDGTSVVFCNTKGPSPSCYASQNNIAMPEGKADYATLLTSISSGLPVVFYCDPGGYAKNIHIQR